MLPLTNKELKPKNTYNYSTIMCAGKYVSLHGVISTLLLPLTIQVIGGQYGELIHPKTEYDPIEPNIKILSLTDMTVLHEVVLISLLFFAHLIGLISVIKKWGIGLVFYFLVRGGELCLSFTWFISVTNNSIKSHVMSQFELGWYCLFALVIEFISSVLVLAVTVQVLKCKKKE
ncbi:uncharacterized protein LOC122854458 [Aphidius gifuensis]|uniref:uncharacterized protein LOC122854458 n=1 Tax=Aphidius gifuensis TaxID=684658 RepID=UPI001CDB6C4E|nr:uncharacterized protein LOC122854458 [Aphidius gifuensis]